MQFLIQTAYPSLSLCFRLFFTLFSSVFSSPGVFCSPVGFPASPRSTTCHPGISFAVQGHTHSRNSVPRTPRSSCSRRWLLISFLAK